MAARGDEVAAIHRECVIVEAHRDVYEAIHLSNLGEAEPLHRVTIPRLRQGGVDVCFYAVGGDTVAHSNGTDRPLRATLENLDRFFREAERPGSEIVHVRGVGDLPGDRPTGKLHFVLTLEGGMPLEGLICNLRIFHRLGVRSLQPTWNVRNELGEGVRERGHGGPLSAFGVEVVREACRIGMLVDVSHLSPRGVDDVLANADGPVIATHSNAASVVPHPRNLSDEHIRGIAATGGVVGIHFAPAFVHATDNAPAHLLDHIDHMVRLVGIDHVGLGPDFIKSDGPRPAREALFGGVQERFLTGLSEIDQLPVLTGLLLERGYGRAEIAKIYGGNFLRVLRQVMGR